MTRVSVALIAKNEAHNIERCLHSAQWADEIVVIDSGSTDNTVELAKRFTSGLFYHPFRDFSDQKNFALSKCTGDWIFFLDADEVATPPLAEEIKRIVQSGAPPQAYAVKRETYFLKKRLRFSGTPSDYPIRLFPRNQARFVQPVHERVQCSLPVGRLRNTLLHYSTRDFQDYRRKLRQYVKLEVELMAFQNRKKRLGDLLFRPLGIFIDIYFLKAGILDGIQGFLYAFFSSYYAFLKYAKYYHQTDPLSKTASLLS